MAMAQRTDPHDKKRHPMRIGDPLRRAAVGRLFAKGMAQRCGLGSAVHDRICGGAALRNGNGFAVWAA
jgi:hypothetical protein